MIDRRVRRSDQVFAAIQLFLESLAGKHKCRAVVLASEEGLAIAGAGSENDLTEVSALATSESLSAKHGIQRFSIATGEDRFFVGALGFVPELECASGLSRILATAAA